MWNLEDSTKYVKFMSLSIPHVWTWASQNDRARREAIREFAADLVPGSRPESAKWAFRIRAFGSLNYDVDNVPKLIIDAFCQSQIQTDRSTHINVGLYPRDTVEHVIMVQVSGDIEPESQLTQIEIYYVIDE